RAGLRGAAPLARGGRRAAPAESRAGAAATALARAHPPAGLPPGLARSGRGAARSDLALSRRCGHGRAAPRGRPRRRLGPHAVRGALPLRRAGVARRRPVRLRGRLARADRSPPRPVARCGGARPANLLIAIDPHSGRVLWERPLPQGSEAALCVWTDSALIVSGERRRELTAARLGDGTRRFSTALPFPGHALLVADEQALIATGPGGAAARIDERGRIAWQLEPEGDSPAERALLQRGVALLRRGGLR